MRWLTDGVKRIVFLCDGCGEPLTGEDQGRVVIEDNGAFAEAVHEGRDSLDMCKVLCRTCLVAKERNSA